MVSLKAIARNPWTWRLLGAVFVGLLIWFVGPLVAIGGWRPFGHWIVRLVLALLPLVLVGFFWWWSRRRAAKKNAALVDALAPPSAGAIEQQDVEGKLRDALGMLRSSKLGKRGAYLYQLPWYAIIGPSGAGKTTALLNAGLEFPTAVAGEYRALRGQPNTPNCDWWFTDEAVLIDTAGRYITQEDGGRDAEGWKGFLELLRKHRPLQPLNGVIVAIPAPDLADQAKLTSHVEQLRARLGELGTMLGQQLPIYLLITKADLLAGFVEYFARGTGPEADQVFGSTAPGEGGDTAEVLSGFDKLVESVSGRLVDQMQGESQLARRARIATFPAQLASLRPAIEKLLTTLARSSRYETGARVRGVYLASGTQTGSPVDRILLTVGVAPPVSEHQVGRGRSFFLKRFFSDLVFPESGLASRNPLAERRQRVRYMGGLVAGAAALLIATGLWLYGYRKNVALIQTVYSTATGYATATGAARGDTPAPAQSLAALNVLGTASDDMKKASDWGLGLGQGSRLSGELAGIYGRDLQRRLAPMLGNLAEQRLAADAAAPAALYEDLKSYLVLGGRGPLSSDQLLAWVQPAWLGNSHDPDAEVEAGDIARHTKAFAEDSFRPVTIDMTRVEQARGVLGAQSPAVRVYGRLKGGLLAKAGAPWTARDHAGPQPDLVFAPGGAFAPGAGIPALFTRTGYEKTFLPAIATGGALFSEERWVVGEGSAQEHLGPAELSALKRDLDRLYFDEFLSRWRGYLGAMQFRKAASLPEATLLLRGAGGPLSPLPPLLKAVAAATDMSRSAAVAAAIPAPGGLAGRVIAASGAGDAAAGGGADDPRAAAARAFEPLRTFVAGPTLDGLLQGMTQLADKLNAAANVASGESGAQATKDAKDALTNFQQSAGTYPEPLSGWVGDLAGAAGQSLGVARQQQMSAAMGANFGATCTAVLAHAFPTQSAAQADMSIADFGRFFAPTGMFAKFVAQDLNGYVDTTGADWKLNPNAAEIGLTEAKLRALQAAQGVTRIFFAQDPQTPRLTYTVEPVALAGAGAVELRIDGQVLKFDGKTPLPATFDWPGAGGASIAFVPATATPPAAGAAPAIAPPSAPHTWPGAWAVFRMMKEAAIKSGGSPALGTGSLTQGGARFDFKVRSMGAINPFAVDPFVRVGCPA